ncbi:GerMN domain-containing protein [[Clostridium] dakarense]|uniref:GerMN domain-containing protein n=1 Tax=Faecalimicrobium dakarense TaxID=1301100 RepID=UPI0004AC6CD2|nr:GerMN domain-containing protein [[Clostridium] dakarense]
MKKFIFLFFIITTLFISLVGCSSTSDLNQVIETPESEDFSKNNEGDVLATIYTSDSSAENIINKEVTLKELSADSLFNELKKQKVINENTLLNSYNSYKENNQVVGIIDFSKEFYDFNLGSSGESLMLDSIAKTYIDNFKLDKFKILVNGNEYESGHILFEKDDFFTKDGINN